MREKEERKEDKREYSHKGAPYDPDK